MFNKKPAIPRRDKDLPAGLCIDGVFDIDQEFILCAAAEGTEAFDAGWNSKIVSVSSLQLPDNSKLYRGYLIEDISSRIYIEFFKKPDGDVEAVFWRTFDVEFPGSADDIRAFVANAEEMWTDGETGVEYELHSSIEGVENGIKDPYGNTGWSSELVTRTYVHSHNMFMRAELCMGDNPGLVFMFGTPLPNNFQVYPGV